MFFNWWSWLNRFEIIRWISLLPFTCLDVVATRPRWDHFLSPGPMVRQNSNVNCVTTGHDFLLLLLLRFNGSLHPCIRITAIFWIYLTPAVPGSWMYSILSDFSYQSCSLKKFHQTLSPHFNMSFTPAPVSPDCSIPSTMSFLSKAYFLQLPSTRSTVSGTITTDSSWMLPHNVESPLQITVYYYYS